MRNAILAWYAFSESGLPGRAGREPEQPPSLPDAGAWDHASRRDGLVGVIELVKRRGACPEDACQGRVGGRVTLGLRSRKRLCLDST
ncbi:MAG TPA: hypothetical protein VF796_18115 [Humisphaera sp.]